MIFHKFLPDIFLMQQNGTWSSLFGYYIDKQLYLKAHILSSKTLFFCNICTTNTFFTDIACKFKQFGLDFIKNKMKEKSTGYL